MNCSESGLEFGRRDQAILEGCVVCNDAAPCYIQGTRGNIVPELVVCVCLFDFGGQTLSVNLYTLLSLWLKYLPMDVHTEMLEET